MTDAGRVQTPPILLRVTVEDVATGDVQTAEIPAGDYVIVTTAPCHVASFNAYANGTVVLTVKGRTAP